MATSTLDTLSEVKQFALTIAQQAGEIIKSFRNDKSWKLGHKGDRNLVTTADVKSQQMIIAAIKSRYPNHEILAEEEGLNDPRFDPFNIPHLWIIDPIDGTTNYVYSQPYVGISIAYALAGAVKVGVVYSPFLEESFSAVHGEGAHLNQQKIFCNAPNNVRESLVATGFPYVRSNIDELSRRTTNIVRECRDLRRNGAASLDLCWVACGRLDAYYETVEPWDMAAGSLIAREAGARVGNKPGGSHKFTGIPDLNGENLLVSHPGIYEEIAKLIWE